MCFCGLPGYGRCISLLFLCCSFTWDVFVLHSGHVTSNNYSLTSLPSELAMVRCWLSKDLIWNYPAWSIHSEWFAYLFVFPVAFVAFRKASNAWILFLVIVTLLAMHSFLPLDRFPGKCPEIVFLFLAGSALYRLRMILTEISGHWAGNCALPLLIVGLGTTLFCSRFLVHLAFALIIFGLSYERGILNRFLSWRLVVYGGTISYSAYMTHALVGKFYGMFFHKLQVSTPLAGGFVALVLIAALLGMAIGFHHLIEHPCNKALRAKCAFKRPTPSVSPGNGNVG